MASPGPKRRWLLRIPLISQQRLRPKGRSQLPRDRTATDRRRTLAGVALTLPALAALGVTMLYPVGWTIWLSLNGPNTAMRGTPDFKGLDNYARIAGSSDFQTALWQTMGLVAASFFFEAIIGLAVALALHRGLNGSKIFSAIVALPLMVAPVVGALAWRFVFGDGYGMIDSIIGLFGAERPAVVRRHLAGPRFDRHRQSLDGAAVRHSRAARRPREPADRSDRGGAGRRRLAARRSSSPSSCRCSSR